MLEEICKDFLIKLSNLLGKPNFENAFNYFIKITLGLILIN